jgi:hypothetical protein
MDCKLETSKKGWFKSYSSEADITGYVSCKIEKVNDKLTESENCTTLLAGVDICRTPKYETLETLSQWKMADFVEPKDNFCIHTNHINDFVRESKFEYLKRRGFIGSGHLPDNYICMEKETWKQYIDGLYSSESQNYYKAHPEVDFYSEKPRCDNRCENNECSTLAQPPPPSRDAVFTAGARFEGKQGQVERGCGACNSAYNKCAPYSGSPNISTL